MKADIAEPPTEFENPPTNGIATAGRHPPVERADSIATLTREGRT